MKSAPINLSGDLPVSTTRLILRPLQQNDATALSTAVNETWDDLEQWMQWATDRVELTALERSRSYAIRCNDLFFEKQDFTFGGFIKETNDLVLVVRVATIPDKINELELCGLWCRRKYQQQGFMHEAIKAIFAFCATALQVKKWYAKHGAGNYASKALLNKLGFKEEEILPSFFSFHDNRKMDAHVLSLECE